MDQFQDQTLTCRDCGNSFVWTASEQKFYADKGFANAPVRCPSCRAAKKATMNGGGGGGHYGGGYSAGPRQMDEIAQLIVRSQRTIWTAVHSMRERRRGRCQERIGHFGGNRPIGQKRMELVDWS